MKDHASLTADCLAAVLDTVPNDVEIVVVDDGSVDDTSSVLASFGDAIRVVTHDTNVGFARACNNGAAAAGAGQYLVFLNNDTLPSAGWLDALTAYADAHPQAAIVGAKLLFLNGTVQHAGTVFSRTGYPYHAYVGFPADHPAVNRSRRHQAVTAACMLIRREAFESVGGFDPSYENGWEDVELCLRLGAEGSEIHYCHTSTVYHFESATRPRVSPYDDRNRSIYDRRWRSLVKPDDLELYAEDGLLTLVYDTWPLRLEVSPLLATVVPDGPSLGVALRERSIQAFRLLEENVRLREERSGLERQLKSAGRRSRARRDAEERRTERRQVTARRGVNVAGYLRGEFGMGEAARLLVSAIETAGIPHRTTALHAGAHRHHYPFRETGTGTAPFDVNILCVPPADVRAVAEELGARFFRDRYTVGVWFWELDELPLEYWDAFRYVDEVWATSRFSRAAVDGNGIVPVRTISPPIVPPRTSDRIAKPDIGLPDRFTYLYMFDFNSIVERKNPEAVVSAFMQAFKADEGPILVLKTINGEQFPEQLKQLTAVTERRPDVLLMDGHMSPTQKNDLLSACDCYVSLHRSEGFGLTMAEAMSLAKPVVATGYSGNLDFMDEHNAFLVPYTLVPVPDGCDPYPTWAQWAEPDTKRAAELIRIVYDDRERAREVGIRAQRDVLTHHSPERRSIEIAQRVAEIQRGPLAGSAPFRSAPARALDAPTRRVLARRSARSMVRRLKRPIAFIQFPPNRLERPVRHVRTLLRPAYRALIRAATR